MPGLGLSLTSTAMRRVSGIVAIGEPYGRPQISVDPQVMGYPYQGRVLTADNGTWTGSPTSYAYQWKRTDPLTAAVTAISGATSASYTPAAADKYFALSVDVTATNASGSATSTSTATIGILPPLASGTTWVAEGDSVSAGYNANAAGSDADPAFAWPKQVANTFGLTFTNNSVGGYTLTPLTQSPNTNTVWNRVMSGGVTGSNKKDAVLIAAGGNDALAGSSYNNTTNFTEYSRRIIGKLLDGGYTRDTIFWSGMYYATDAGLSGKSISRAYWETFVEAARAVASEYGLPFFDFYAKVPAAADMSSDNIHPTRAGHTNLAASAAANQPYSQTIPKTLNPRAQVTGLTAVGGVTQLTAEWTAFAGASGYTVRVVNATTFATVATQTATGTSAIITGLAAGSYKTQVNAQGVSGGSTPWTQSTLAAMVTAVAYFLNDTFGGSTNGATLNGRAADTTGGTWTVGQGGMALTASGRVYISSNGPFSYNSVVPPSADYFVEVVAEYLSAVSGEAVTFAGRADVAAKNWYQVQWTGGNWALQRVAGGSVAATLGTYADAFNSGSRTVRLVLSGSALSVAINGTTRITATDANITAAGRVGFGGALVQTATTGRQVTSIVASGL